MANIQDLHGLTRGNECEIYSSLAYSTRSVSLLGTSAMSILSTEAQVYIWPQAR